MVEELNSAEIADVNGGSKETFSWGYEIGVAIADTIALFRGA